MAREITFIWGRDLRVGDLALVWWGVEFARVTGFEPLSAATADAADAATGERHTGRFAEFHDGREMTVFDDTVLGIVVTCPEDVARGGLPENSTTRIPAGWVAGYGGNAWLSALDYNTLADVEASTTLKTSGLDAHGLLAALDEVTRAPGEAFARYCGLAAAQAGRGGGEGAGE